GEDGRLHEVAVLELRPNRRPAAYSDLRALGLGLGDVRQDAVALFTRDQRADVGRQVERVADLHRADPGHQSLDDLVLAGARDEQSGSRFAGLAVVRQAVVDRAIDGDVQIGVVEQDVRTLAAQL